MMSDFVGWSVDFFVCFFNTNTRLKDFFSTFLGVFKNRVRGHVKGSKDAIYQNRTKRANFRVIPFVKRQIDT